MDDVSIPYESTRKVIRQQYRKSNQHFIKGFFNNLIESFYALLGIPAHESETKPVNEDPMQ